MPAGSTYTPIATTTLGSTASSYTFSSIPSTYTDLRLVTWTSITPGPDNTVLRFNGDTGSNYSSTYLGGSGSAASSGRFSNTNSIYLGYIGTGVQKFDIMNYSNTTTNKTVLCRSDDASSWIEASVGLWRSTAAINSITIRTFGSTNFAAGTTFTLEGIQAA